MTNWKNTVKVLTRPTLVIHDDIRNDGRVEALGPTPAELRAAAVAFDARRDAFAAGKGATCRDIAARVIERGYASEKQRDFAAKLVEWSKPRAPASANGLPVPKLFAVMQKHATLHAGDLKISRKNQDTMCWLVLGQQVVGKLADGVAILWPSKMSRESGDTVRGLLVEFEQDPLAAAMKYGKLSGCCCSCGRDLTDPASIGAGIGPICAQKF